jgi:hypothetical protein
MITFAEFLKKYSTIPNLFIDNFYGIIKDYKELDDLFYISLDDVSKWINQNKGNIKRTLVKYFSKNVDYTLENKGKFYTYDQSVESRNNEMGIGSQDRKNNRAEMGGYGLG